MEVRGRDGRSIEELWSKDGPRAYLGTMAPGFPNFFMIYGPNMNAYGGLGVLNLEEMAVRYMLSCIEHLVLNGERSMDVTETAYWRWNDELDERESSGSTWIPERRATTRTSTAARRRTARSPALRCGTG